MPDPTSLAEAIEARLANAADEARLRAANAGTRQPAQSWQAAITAHYNPPRPLVTREEPAPLTREGSPR